MSMIASVKALESDPSQVVSIQVVSLTQLLVWTFTKPGTLLRTHRCTYDVCVYVGVC